MTDSSLSVVDRRRVWAMRLLAGSALSMIGLAALALGVISWARWPDAVAPLRIRALSHIGALALAVLVLHVSAWAFVLGPMEWRAKAGRFELEAAGGGDQVPETPADDAVAQPAN